MYNYLNKFHKNMEWVGVVESIVTKVNNSQKFNDYFSNHDIINHIFTVLYFIREKTLSEDKDCAIRNISSFMKENLGRYYDLELDDEEITKLVKFIVIEVLQNNGESYKFSSRDYNDLYNSLYPIKIKLIEDFIIKDSINKENGYILSKQGFEFLFRIDDIEEELEISIEQIRLKELLKRKKFGKAKEQCKMMVNRIRQKRKDIEKFLRKIKENINEVDLEDCKEIIDSTFNLLLEEHEKYNELYEMIKEIESNIIENLELDRDNKELINSKKDIENIRKSIRTVLNEYHMLFRSQKPVYETYDEAINNNLMYVFRERLDIEKDILERVENITDYNTLDNLHKIFNPTFNPSVNRHLNIFNVYEEQGIVEEEDNDKKDIKNAIDVDGVDETDDTDEKMIEQMNSKYCLYIRTILNTLLDNKKEMFLEEILEIIKYKDIDIYNEVAYDKLFYKTIMLLYDIGNIDLKELLKENKSIIVQKNEDFNVNYIFGNVLNNNKYKDVSRLIVDKENDKILTLAFEERDSELIFKHEINISNFKLKVVE